MSDYETVTIAEFDVATLGEIIPGDWRRIDSFLAEWDHDRGMLVVTAEVERVVEGSQ